MGSSRRIARFCRIPHLSALNSQPANSVFSRPDRSWLGSAAGRLTTGFHWRGLCRSFEQALALRCPVRAKIGIAGLVADRNDHPGTPGDLCGSLGPTALEAAVEAELRPLLRVLTATATKRHSIIPGPRAGHGVAGHQDLGFQLIIVKISTMHSAGPQTHHRSAAETGAPAFEWSLRRAPSPRDGGFGR